MGILAEPMQYVRELGLPRGFAVCELGNQFVTAAERPLEAREFYESLGCGTYHAVDGNGRGTITADLNDPLPKTLHGQFDLVTDFGTGEHVFDQRQVFRTMHDLTRAGGYMVFDRPSDGYDGHCFYLIQWNLLSALAHANEYEVVRMTKYASTRGTLIRGTFKKNVSQPFVVPQQGRYYRDLVIDDGFLSRGAEYKSKVLREAGMVAGRPKKKSVGGK